MTTLQTLSVIALVIYFAVLLFAVAKEKKNNNVLDYFFAGRSLPFWALSITFIASWWGAGSAIATADLAYQDGLAAFWYYGVPVLISTFLMILTSKKIRRVGFLTQGHMLKARYSKAVANMLSFLILIFMTFTAASQMVGIGFFFGSYIDIQYEYAVLLGTGIVLIYSMFGGFRGVVLTDIIQFILLALSAFIIFIFTMQKAGSFANIEIAASKIGKDNYLDFSNGAIKYLTYVITFGCAWMIQANVWQRISAAKNDSDARKMTILSFFAYIPLYLIVVFTGMACITVFDTLPQNGVIATIVIEYMPPYLGALAFIGISAAIMSTMDSLINTGAMTLTLDLFKVKGTDQQKIKFSRYATLIVTLVALFIAIKKKSILDIAWIASDIITTGVFVPLVLGYFWRRGNSTGALLSMITGFLYCFYNLLISFNIKLPAFWNNQSTMQVIIGMSLSLIVYMTASLVTKAEYEKADAFIKATKEGNENNL